MPPLDAKWKRRLAYGLLGFFYVVAFVEFAWGVGLAWVFSVSLWLCITWFLVVAARRLAKEPSRRGIIHCAALLIWWRSYLLPVFMKDAGYKAQHLVYLLAFPVVLMTMPQRDAGHREPELMADSILPPGTSLRHIALFALAALGLALAAAIGQR